MNTNKSCVLGMALVPFGNCLGPIFLAKITRPKWPCPWKLESSKAGVITLKVKQS